MARREYKKISLRIDPALHERVSKMLDAASAKRHRNVPLNYIVQELLRSACEEHERPSEDKRQPTFNAFVRDYL